MNNEKMLTFNPPQKSRIEPSKWASFIHLAELTRLQFSHNGKTPSMRGPDHAISDNSSVDPDQFDCPIEPSHSERLSRRAEGPRAANEFHDLELVNDLILALAAGIGPRTITRLFNRFEDSTEIMRATRQELLSVPSIGNKLVESIQNAPNNVPVSEILKWCQRNACRIHRKSSPSYPARLREIEDAPLVLFHQGDQDFTARPAVAVVGTRNPTPYGCQQAKRISQQLAEAGIVIVSGLARGIDSISHQACLESNGQTVAVLGSGLAQVYPPENRSLAQRIRQHGTMLSEYDPNQRPNKNSFPRRNRIISGLSVITLVIEAPRKSGSLITARLALEQNRDVMAIPGPISSEMSRGCNDLIRDGAKLVQDIDDILEELPGDPLFPRFNHRKKNQPPLSLSGHNSWTKNHKNTSEKPSSQTKSSYISEYSAAEKKIIEAIAPDGSAIDTIIQRTQLPAQNVIASVSLLEIRGILAKSNHQKIYLR